MGFRIAVADGEPIDLALRRFKKSLQYHGAMMGLRRQEQFIKPTQTRRAKRFKKRFKARIATLMAKHSGEQPASSVSEAARSFWKKTGKP